METAVLLFLVFRLLGAVNTLECAHCNLGRPCLYNQTCPDTTQICVSLEVFNTSARGTYKGCLATSSCMPLAFTISGASDRRVQSNMACCDTSGCNDKLTLSVPPSSSWKNGVNCPACENQNSALCKSQGEVPCTGAEEKCITLEGVSIELPDHNFSMRGCATATACDLKKEGLMSFGGEVYRLTQNATCTNKGGLKALPPLATVTFQVIVGVSLANVLF